MHQANQRGTPKSLKNLQIFHGFGGRHVANMFKMSRMWYEGHMLEVLADQILPTVPKVPTSNSNPRDLPAERDNGQNRETWKIRIIPNPFRNTSSQIFKDQFTTGWLPLIPCASPKLWSLRVSLRNSRAFPRQGQVAVPPSLSLRVR